MSMDLSLMISGPCSLNRFEALSFRAVVDPYRVRFTQQLDGAHKSAENVGSKIGIQVGITCPCLFQMDQILIVRIPIESSLQASRVVSATI